MNYRLDLDKFNVGICITLNLIYESHLITYFIVVNSLNISSNLITFKINRVS